LPIILTKLKFLIILQSANEDITYPNVMKAVL